MVAIGSHRSFCQILLYQSSNIDWIYNFHASHSKFDIKRTRNITILSIFSASWIRCLQFVLSGCLFAQNIQISFNLTLWSTWLQHTFLGKWENHVILSFVWALLSHLWAYKTLAAHPAFLLPRHHHTPTQQSQNPSIQQTSLQLTTKHHTIIKHACCHQQKRSALACIVLRTLCQGRNCKFTLFDATPSQNSWEQWPFNPKSSLEISATSSQRLQMKDFADGNSFRWGTSRSLPTNSTNWRAKRSAQPAWSNASANSERWAKRESEWSEIWHYHCSNCVKGWSTKS